MAPRTRAAQAPCTGRARTGMYRRRRPEATRVYRLVQDWLETWLAHRERYDGQPVPGYVERELRRFLECGILAHGFARARCPECGTDFLVAFSCKGRGVCTSCASKRMAATAAHLSELVIPRVPMRQWVLSVPKRLRPALRAEPRLASRVLAGFVEAIETRLRRARPDAGPTARVGAVSFLQRFGSALNEHWHYHCCVTDGLFLADAQRGLAFDRAVVDDADVAAVAAQVRRDTLAVYRRRGWLAPEDAEAMAGWAHGGGFSVDASVGIGANDRAGLERLLRYCARPCFAAERLHPGPDGEGVVYELAKPRPDGTRRLALGPMAFLDRLARLIPEPRRHQHRYHGVFAPNAPLRRRVTQRAGQPVARPSEAPGPDTQALPSAIQAVLGTGEVAPTPAPRGASQWARLIARIYEVDPLVCPDCGGRMRLIAFIIERTAITRILEAIGEPALAPRAAPIRDPPGTEHPMSEPALAHEPAPSYEDQDQRVSW